MPPLHGRPLSKVLDCHHQIVGCYIFIVVATVSLSLLQYLEPPPAVMQDYTSGQLHGVRHSTCLDAYSTHNNLLSKLWSGYCRCMFWFGKRSADWRGALQEATSLAAKAEVLQASIGVSCNEIDIQTTTQNHSEDASEDAYPESSSAVQDGAGIDGGVEAIDAKGMPCTDSAQPVPPSTDLLTSSASGSLIWLKQRYKSFVMTLYP